MQQPQSSRVTVETVRQLSLAADIRPDDEQLVELARALEALLVAIERCDALGLASHEPAARFELRGG